MDGEQLRRTVLEVVRESGSSSILQSGSVLQESAKRLDIKGVEHEQAILAFFGDLFRIGYLAWGYNLSNPSPPFCHITERGRIALASLSRDPSNPDGYLASLHDSGKLGPVTESYIREALFSKRNIPSVPIARISSGVTDESERRTVSNKSIDSTNRPTSNSLVFVLKPLKMVFDALTVKAPIRQR